MARPAKNRMGVTGSSPQTSHSPSLSPAVQASNPTVNIPAIDQPIAVRVIRIRKAYKRIYDRVRTLTGRRRKTIETVLYGEMTIPQEIMRKCGLLVGTELIMYAYRDGRMLLVPSPVPRPVKPEPVVVPDDI